MNGSTATALKMKFEVGEVCCCDCEMFVLSCRTFGLERRQMVASSEHVPAASSSRQARVSYVSQHAPCYPVQLGVPCDQLPTHIIAASTLRRYRTGPCRKTRRACPYGARRRLLRPLVLPYPHHARSSRASAVPNQNGTPKGLIRTFRSLALERLGRALQVA